ncbi:MAG: fibrobacter succinogenes major paralogous domain-containing protein [Fibrobacter sp.]|nr:fibrobacter succinogenes major paralogous domain-containing protein [Fibrobacter sp.]
MKNFSLSLFVFTAMFLAACGDDITEEYINQIGLEVVDKVADLPKCTEDNKGETFFVKGENSQRVCVDGKWYAAASNDKDTVVVKDTVVITKNTSCTTKELKDKSGVKIICGGDSVGVVLNGKNGVDGKNGSNGKDGAAGSGCSVVTLKDNSGLKVICGGDSVGVVLNGKEGAKGDKGDIGVTGAGCSMKKLDDTSVRVICGKDSTTLYTGAASDIGGGSNPVVLDSEKVAVSLDEVSGVTQKGPFLSGSKVLVREMEDGRTLTQTGNSFNGKILNDKGEFKINARMLVSQYVMLEATGYYRNEVTGKNSNSELTLFAITDVNQRNIVNVNLLTHLEYERVVYLVTQKKMKVNAAKKQAQKEVFGLLDIDATGFSNSEDLNIAGSSSEDGALLAFSLLFQGDRTVAQLTELLTKIATDMEKDGTWDDAKTKMAIAEWASDADSAGRFETIRNNVKAWGLSSMVPNFEQHVRHFWNTEYGLGDCSAKTVGVVKAATAGKRKGSKTRYICKDFGGAISDYRWVVASDIEKDTYGWKDGADGVLKTGDITGKIYVFDKLGSFNGTKGWREAESIEKQHGGCIEALYDSIRTDKVYAYYYTCKKSTHTWVREVDYLIIDTQYWPDSTDGAVKWGDSVGVVDNLERICYVWDDAKQYKGWRAGNTSDCNLGLLGCTAKRGGEMRKSADGRYYSCSENSWVEITDEVYINTYLYRCTIDGEGERVYKDGDLVYGIEFKTTRYACENEQWRSTKPGEEQAGKACTARLQGYILGDTITCDTLNWRTTIVYDYPVSKKWFNEDLKYGTLKDERDGRVYRTIKIGDQVWMAENLAYGDSVKNPYLKENSWCYNDDTLNCLKGGRYYSWTAAMDIHYKWQNASPYEVEGLIGEPHQGICPDGWHIPTDNEWRDMYDAVGTTPYALQVEGQRLWRNATNASGFSAIPTGYFFYSDMQDIGEYGGLWSVRESEDGWHAYPWSMRVSSAGFDYLAQKNSSFPVRCIQDSPKK